MLPLPLSLLLLLLLFLLLLPEIGRCSSGVGMRWGRWLSWGFVRLVIFGILRGRMLLFDFVYLFPCLFLDMCMFGMFSTAWLVYYVYDIAWMEGLCYGCMYIIAIAITA